MPAPHLYPVFRYVVDAFDRICYTSPEWEEFAADNAVACLSGSGVIGKPLMEFIVDPETREIYRALLDRVRRDRRPVTLHLRCDSPALRRFLELTISPARGEEVQFMARILRLEPRDPVPLLDAGAPRSADFLTICGWCKRVRAGAAWLEVEDAVDRLNLFDRSPLPQLSHGICPECSQRMQREIDAGAG